MNDADRAGAVSDSAADTIVDIAAIVTSFQNIRDQFPARGGLSRQRLLSLDRARGSRPRCSRVGPASGMGNQQVGLSGCTKQLARSTQPLGIQHRWCRDEKLTERHWFLKETEEHIARQLGGRLLEVFLVPGETNFS